MKRKEIIIDYQEYLENETSRKILIHLLATVYLNENISKDLKEEIKRNNSLYGWWV